MAKSKSKTPKPEAETAEPSATGRQGPSERAPAQVESNDEVEDMNAASVRATDPYTRKPKVETTELPGGRKVETYI